ncbi:Glutamate receptor ionotropic, kainate 3 [Collichthys lucidus]|uniref:Glutamate receptor ionotropic, kainate 3 n=1 Tax=Collichthys lucidus TaxID=240159 RepID=A0A4U5V4Z1_COLLU|nr:Glutamate receptor ionotropic, kainate 3 [Collichthys lucidus]
MKAQPDDDAAAGGEVKGSSKLLQLILKGTFYLRGTNINLMVTPWGKSGSRDFTTMRNTWLSPRSAIWEYWTSLIACLFWIHYSYGMPHVIRIDLPDVTVLTYAHCVNPLPGVAVMEGLSDRTPKAAPWWLISCGALELRSDTLAHQTPLSLSGTPLIAQCFLIVPYSALVTVKSVIDSGMSECQEVSVLRSHANCNKCRLSRSPQQIRFHSPQMWMRFYTNLRVAASVIDVNDDYETGYKKL